jgi:mitogen-activated protein kinase kinase
MQEKMKTLMLSRQGTPPGQSGRNPGALGGMQPGIAGPIPNGVRGGVGLGGGMSSVPAAMRGPLVGGAGGFTGSPHGRPPNISAASAPAIPNTLGAKRGFGKLRLSDASGPLPPNPNALGSAGNGKLESDAPKPAETSFTKYEKIVDTKTGTLNFAGKATIHGQGIEFRDGGSFSISLDEVDTLEELGKGNYGTVYQVRHSRPKIRRPGMGLQGNKAPHVLSPQSSSSPIPDHLGRPRRDSNPSPTAKAQGNTTGLIMAMKEIRLELDEAKFAAIIMELDILHRCVSPFIIDFYGAFFQEGAVYICMEFMDGGSVDKLYGDGIPENILRKIALSTIMGLKSLKDDHNIIHRDVKPTNILVNSRGQTKICDFGVSGNLVASIAKTNIGCQSYMAPERITGGGVAQAGANPGGGTYSVQSDIWSLGLSIIECAMGRYPYPPETYNNIFSQLSVSPIFPPLPTHVEKESYTYELPRQSSTATPPTSPKKAGPTPPATSSINVSTKSPIVAPPTPC